MRSIRSIAGSPQGFNTARVGVIRRVRYRNMLVRLVEGVVAGTVRGSVDSSLLFEWEVDRYSSHSESKRTRRGREVSQSSP